MSISLETIIDVHLTHRRKSGQSAHRLERALRKFNIDMQASSEKFISYKFTTSWLQREFPTHSNTSKLERYSYVQMLSEWANALDRRHQHLPKKTIPRDKRTPNILTPLEMSNFIQQLAEHPTRGGFNGYSSSIITGLMYVTGMRIGETFALKRENFDWKEATVYVPEGKSQCDRYIPLTRSTIKTLLEYSKKRDARFPHIDNPFFLFDRGVAKTRKPYTDLFRKVATREDIVKSLESDIRENPLRPHDIRHCFAVNSLIKCYEEDRNIDEEVAKLSILLGHKSVKETYWYIEGVPRLLEIAMNVGVRS